jgi:phosphatidylserine/phosphatidylglycerophosphate/cardiolipin synthase-like enzyme
MSKPYAFEVRQSPRGPYLKVFLRDDGEAESLRSMLCELKSVKAANTTPSQSRSHPGMTLTIYSKATYDIEEVKKEVETCLDSYFGNGHNKNFEKAISLNAKFKGIESQILSQLNRANATIDVCVAWFTNPILAQKLEEKAKKGVKVRILVNDDNTNLKYIPPFDPSLNIELKRIKADKKSGIMHQKFCVIDNNDVITGSYNWSTSAEFKNDENIQVVSNNTDNASKYTKEFNRQWDKD